MMVRSRGSVILVVLFTLFGLNAWVQVINAIIGGSDDPAALIILQTLVGTAGIAAAAVLLFGLWAGWYLRRSWRRTARQ